ncbi:MAG: alginate lyase family protein [Beijerinckiaceae bacterium]|jgi:poly(beta-D-mannuronate) lyase|nr:alginate lyase family protein [Beijerinckiaceae bacterium]
MHRLVLPLALVAGLAIASPALGQETCPPPPSAVVDITSNRFYTDKANSIVDQAAWDRRMASVKPLEDFRREVTRFSSRGLSGNKAWSQCAGRWIAHWAAGGALLGRMSEIQAHYERKWALAAIAMAYLMAKPDMPEAERRQIEPWLDRVANAVAADYPKRKAQPNNHYYWLGFALGATATATGNARHWALAAETYAEAMTHIERDGSLPRETARAGMALHYHAFSIKPLVMLAELAARRGENWYPRKDGAIHRLARLVLENYADPKTMAIKANATQKPLARGQLSWLPLYARRFPERVPGGLAIGEGDLWDGMLGGNISALARAWAR